MGQHYKVSIRVHCCESVPILIWPYMLPGRKTAASSGQPGSGHQFRRWDDPTACTDVPSLFVIRVKIALSDGFEFPSFSEMNISGR